MRRAPKCDFFEASRSLGVGFAAQHAFNFGFKRPPIIHADLTASALAHSMFWPRQYIDPAKILHLPEDQPKLDAAIHPAAADAMRKALFVQLKRSEILVDEF